MSEGNVSGLDARRRAKGGESITTTDAQAIARRIKIVFIENGFKDYVQDMQRPYLQQGGIHNALRRSQEAQASQELEKMRQKAGGLKTEELFAVLGGYEKQKIKKLTPEVVAAAEECVRRLSISPLARPPINR